MSKETLQENSAGTSLSVQREIAQTLKSLIKPTTRLVVVHSNLSALDNIGNDAQVVLDALEKAIPQGCTIAIPTFTFSFCQTGLFDLEQTPSEVETLGEEFRKHPGVVRTPHPIYSFALRGPLADTMASGVGSTCWGEDSLFEWMEKLDAELVMLGCSWDHCALFCRVEELAKVPYRFKKRFDGIVRSGHVSTSTHVDMYVDRRHVPVRNRFERLEEELRKWGCVRSSALGKGMVEVAGARDIMRLGLALVKEDPFVLAEDPLRVRSDLIKARVAFLGSSNLDIFAQHFRAQAAEWMWEGTHVFVPPFHQYKQQLISSQSDLKEFDPEWLFFMERARDVFGPLLLDPMALSPVEQDKEIHERVDQYTEMIVTARQSMKGKILILKFDVPAFSPLSLADEDMKSGQHELIKKANERLEQNLHGLSDVWLIDFECICAAFGRMPSEDPKFWYLGKIPFSRDFSLTLARRLVGVLLSLMGRTARTIVVDLDNTLWGGTVGEDGIEKIQVGGDFPGNAYQDFQRTLLALKRRGIALAICSKNTPEIALQALNNHPAMILRESDFAVHRINWVDKPSNVIEIAQEMSLGLHSLCFLDNDPHERALMRQRLPQVFVPDLPADPVQYSSFVLDLPCLEALLLTQEDANRENQYQFRREVQEARNRFQSVEEFYRYLKMTLIIENYTPTNQARTLQLLTKTNQFNTTTRRYTQMDLETLKQQGASLWPIALADRFSDKEIVGLIIVCWPDGGDKPAVVDSLLLSCRVLGRSIEIGMLGWIVREARRRNVSAIDGLVIPSERNQPVRDLYSKNGFVEIGNGCYRMNLSTSDLRIPDWFEVQQGS